ncbi:MAG: 2-oxoacid:acceptor oxidoreductase subunit alpha [Synergistetes bacterium]|nr:2-oxoacid:acceptor oxidoreductase subunit alpha [Synergistota bacterium]MDW8191663.1 2-oxoacid:acceptor oxidoreductase subunit alpha [Synergistota bacterium]
MGDKNRIMFIQGNEAIAEAAIIAGARFFAGYPITPATEIAEVLAYRMPQVGGVFIQMEDEIASIAAVIGASMAGFKAMTATSGPGFTLMQENIGYAIMVEAPCVVVDVQRGGPSTGLPTLPAQGDVMQSRWGTHGDHPIVVLSPATVQEAFDLTIKAFNISELVRNPVILLTDAVVGHLREKMIITDEGEIEIINRRETKLPPEQYKPCKGGVDFVPDYARPGTGYRYHVTSNVHDEEGFPATYSHKAADELIKRLHKKIDYYRDKLTYYKSYYAEDADVLIITYGCTARSAKDAVKILRDKGVKAGLLQLQTIWPFPYDVVEGYAKKAKLVVVPEMNMGQLIGEIERAIKREALGVNRADGKMISPAEIVGAIKGVLKDG